MYSHNFEDTFYKIYPRLVRSLMIICLNDKLAKELALKSCTDLYVKWNKIQNNPDIDMWVYTQAISYLTKIAKNNKNTSYEINLPTFEIIEQSLQTPNNIEFVRSLITLSDQQRIIATLSWVDNYTPTQISEILNDDETTVKTCLNRLDKYFEEQNAIAEEFS